MASTRNVTLPNIGQLCMIETTNEILIGTVKFTDKIRKIIELDNVRDQKTNYAYSSTQILGIPQIRTIKIIHNDVDDDDEEKEQSIDSAAESQAEQTSFDTTSGNSSNSDQNYAKKREKYRMATGGDEITNTARTMTITSSPSKDPTSDESGISCASVHLSSTELQLLQEQLNSITYIEQADYSYHKAIADIKTQSIVSLLVEPLQFGRHRKTSLIAIATHRVVYIFDIISLGRVFREFKAILESERPRKVVHYSHKMVDHLQHRQAVQLGGIFDTFVAHCMTTGKKQPLSLVETVLYTFNISEMYFDYEKEYNDDDNESYDTYRRPVARRDLQYIAKRAIFQLKLYEHLLHEQMLANFYKQCNNFSKSFSENDDLVEVAMQMQPNSRQGYEHIQPDGNVNQTLVTQLKLLDL